MPRFGSKGGLAGPVLVGWLASAAAAEEPNHPPFFAIENARLVTGSGEALDRATIVLAHGLISALGSEVSIPPEARVIDGSGFTVYPGLVDALTDLGLPSRAERENARGSNGERRREHASGPEDRPATTPWRSGADELEQTEEEIRKWRSQGFTSAVVVPADGIFPGQGSVVNLAGERPRDMVVASPVALRVNLQPTEGFRSFPGSLMGVTAYVRQMFLDADQYRAAWSIYAEQPRGLERPRYDRTLAPLAEARTSGRPVLIPGSWSKEIRRAIELGEELGLRTVVYGAHQGYEAAELLREKNVPVLVNAEWPARPEDADPEAEVPLRVLRLRDRAPSTPAALEEAGVRFAFYSGGLKQPEKVLENVRRAVAAGLSKEAALAALTSTPASIYGVGEQLGSLEAGKIANLVVTEGDLFDEGSRVRWVFVDGRPYEPRETETEETKPATAEMDWGSER